MKSINKVILVGAVGQDPEVRFTAAGLCVASFSLATSEKRKDKEQITQWHNCVAFGKLGEIVQQYIVKGSKLYLEGTISYQQYEKEGEKRYATKIIVNDVSMLSSNVNPDSKSQNSSQKAHAKAAPASAESAQEFHDDDIPF